MVSISIVEWWKHVQWYLKVEFVDTRFLLYSHVYTNMKTIYAILSKQKYTSPKWSYLPLDINIGFTMPVYITSEYSDIVRYLTSYTCQPSRICNTSPLQPLMSIWMWFSKERICNSSSNNILPHLKWWDIHL